ncbi:MAG: hypothetical protein ABR555_05470 [Pyrinomonadaceae bacterium]
MKKLRIGPLFVGLVLLVQASNAQTTDRTIEPFQVLELPLTVHEASLVRTDGAYHLTCVISNNSEFRILGITYALVAVDSTNVVRAIANPREALRLGPYATKTVTFSTPLRRKIKDEYRLVLMVEQVLTREYIWEVMKAKQSLNAYAGGDYSAVPRVLRLANEVDVPPRPVVIY